MNIIEILLKSNFKSNMSNIRIIRLILGTCCCLQCPTDTVLMTVSTSLVIISSSGLMQGLFSTTWRCCMLDFLQKVWNVCSQCWISGSMSGESGFGSNLRIITESIYMKIPQIDVVSNWSTMYGNASTLGGSVRGYMSQFLVIQMSQLCDMQGVFPNSPLIIFFHFFNPPHTFCVKPI